MNIKFIFKAISVALISLSLTLISAVSFAATDVRIMWYGDGDKENVPIAAQIDEFNAANPDINVILDIVPYDAIMNTLPIQLAAGEGPDIARVTDLGGLNIAYEALQKAYQGSTPEPVDGLTSDQRFFIGYAQVWRQNIRDKELMRRLKIDVHSPGDARVNIPPFNMDVFLSAFEIKEDNNLFIPVTERANIW